MPASAKPAKNRAKTKSTRDTSGPSDAAVAGGLEGLLCALTGQSRRSGPRSKRSNVDAAQKVIYDAWEAPSPARRIALARKALEVSADCADAYVLLAQEAANTVEAARDLYAKGVAAGERALGRKAFRDYEGHFWGFLETRPYMRARRGLALCLHEMGERDAAIGHLQDMLRLNPGDNQGLRYLLASWLIEKGDGDGFERLERQFSDDACAALTYPSVLHEYRRSGASPAAAAKLAAALESNRHVPAYLLGKRRMARSPSGLITWGGEDEAQEYVRASASSWHATPGALDWLAASTAGSLGPKRLRPAHKRPRPS